jgi:hypothetical protein
MAAEMPMRDRLLDGILIPRANGSDGLARVESFIASTLEARGAEVQRQPFTATPYGLQLAWTAALLLMIGSVTSILGGWHGAALVLALAAPTLLLMEFELLWSPVSGLLKRTENNVIGHYDGRPGGPTLALCAHYDTTTHAGDHRSWGPLGWWWLGPAVALAIAMAVVGIAGHNLPVVLSIPLSALVLAPFAAMAWYQGAGPLLHEPSPGALDNGGAVVALLELSGRLGERPSGTGATVELVFTAAEEERAFGSRAHADTLACTSHRLPASAVDAPHLAVVNLELIGADGKLGYVPIDGFALRRYESPSWLVELVEDTALESLGLPLSVIRLPAGTLTDGRSYLARGIAAVTLSAAPAGGFPRRLHSSGDSRGRLSPGALDRCGEFLDTLVKRFDAEHV